MIETRRPTAVLAVIAAAAWLALLLGSSSPYGRYLDHEQLETSGVTAGALLVFVVGWCAMVIATLLPTTAPLMGVFGRVAGRRPHAGGLQVALVAGFLAVWTLVGAVAYLADSLVHQMVDALPWLSQRPQVVTAGVLTAAGLYQLSALKQSCLTRCRSPRALLFRHWGGPRPAAYQAASVGVAHGITCVGCCWPLMMLMFAFGLGSLSWMVLLAVVMAFEKTHPSGSQLTVPLAVVLLACAVVVLIAA